MTPSPNLIGKTVALVLYPDTLVPAKVLDYAEVETGAGSVRRIDYEYTLHDKVRVDANEVVEGLLAFRYEDREMTVSGKGARWADPCLRSDGPPLATPQSGHFVPGTWFDPSPYLIHVEAIKDAIPEVRGASRVPGALGPLRQAAQPGKHDHLGPFEDLAEAYETFRKARDKYDHVQFLFSRRPRAQG